jgi:hypothetical protein
MVGSRSSLSGLPSDALTPFPPFAWELLWRVDVAAVDDERRSRHRHGAVTARPLYLISNLPCTHPEDCVPRLTQSVDHVEAAPRSEMRDSLVVTGFLANAGKRVESKPFHHEELVAGGASSWRTRSSAA